MSSRSTRRSHKNSRKRLHELENQTKKLTIESNEIKLKNQKSADYNKNITTKFLEFFGSIPEYDDVNHLSNKDFYKKLENLREKQREYNEYLASENKIRTDEWVKNNYQKNYVKTTTTTHVLKSPKPFCTTPILKIPKTREENFEVLSLSDKETYHKQPSSRRSVRIETPATLSLKSSSSSPELNSKSPSQEASVGPETRTESVPKFGFKSRPGSGPVFRQKPGSRPGSEEVFQCEWLDLNRDGGDGITIPKPFQMTVKDEENQLVEKCLNEANSSRKSKEKNGEMFKANPVPIESQIPLFDKIMADQEYKNHLVRERRKADLMSQMRPFSFTKRDEELQNISKRLSKSSPCICPVAPEEDKSEEFKNFKAKPVPKALFSNYIYHKMYEDEFFRSLQKKIRAEEMLKAASLPPSMARREKNKKIYDVCPKIYKKMSYNDYTDFPEFMRSKKIPNFVKLNDQELEEFKREFPSQNFRSKKSRLKIRGRSDPSSSSSRTNSAASGSGLRAVSRSNLAAVLRIESARKRLRDHMDEKLEEARLKEEARWREKILRKKPVWQSLAFSNEEDLAMRLRMRKEEERLRNEEHRLRMDLMFGRVNQQPTLFERQSQVKFPRTKEEVLEFVYNNSHSKPRRTVSDLSNNTYCVELKEEAIQVDPNELEVDECTT